MRLYLATLLLTLASIFMEVSAASPKCKTSEVWLGKKGYAVALPVASGAGGGPECDMNGKSNNEGVRSLQYTLNKCYSAGLSEDGVYGAKTKAAVKSAQIKEHGQSHAGIYTRDTMMSIKWYGWRGPRKGKCDQFYKL